MLFKLQHLTNYQYFRFHCVHKCRSGSPLQHNYRYSLQYSKTLWSLVIENICVQIFSIKLGCKLFSIPSSSYGHAVVIRYMFVWHWSKASADRLYGCYVIKYSLLEARRCYNLYIPCKFSIHLNVLQNLSRQESITKSLVTFGVIRL